MMIEIIIKGYALRKIKDNGKYLMYVLIFFGYYCFALAAGIIAGDINMQSQSLVLN
ncbi:hypothetical protein [Wolbachia endosymbiont of Dirofilaria (Dirofilaria) immitis]|uniref:hypothetical protein n=1 Tax=Wolbachia endosymbiont of Dirofilaria (Dirofilaria) immitis TaxID=1812115 RepID=UPI00158BCD73|nr:hypothetical protein [Wolbachia endosymbiont of Dirofilaria (Dirofilaria) immitis]QKX02206.1 hypothetical protein GOY12_01315 [Wolbachia endosymbiont of Dirofilaria (Dirofilaria) immitis]